MITYKNNETIFYLNNEVPTLVNFTYIYSSLLYGQNKKNTSRVLLNLHCVTH